MGRRLDSSRWKLTYDELDGILIDLGEVTGEDVIPMVHLQAAYFIHAIEVLGSRKKAAKALGITPSTGYRWLQRAGLLNYFRDTKASETLDLGGA
jgi:DNA invertase Pin-like site-specific DNA recombinase